ncbi:hypothetical protein EV122DRAFT_223956 [Schizophyllum commune]
MSFATFSDDTRRQWACIPMRPEPAIRALNPMDLLSLETKFMIFDQCSPHDLCVLRQTCPSIKAMLDSDLDRWVRARTLLGVPSPSPDLVGAPTDSPVARERAWVRHVFTGVLNVRTEAPLAWQLIYSQHWNVANDQNITQIRVLLEEQPFKALKIKVTFDEIMRTPTCQTLFQAFRRDLKIIDLASWTLVLPSMLRELGLIASCNVAAAPSGFRYNDLDRIICPVCHPRLDGFRQTLNALPSTVSRPKWFAQNTVRVGSLINHFLSRHASLLSMGEHPLGPLGMDIIPRIPIYTYCSTCQRNPEKHGRRKVFTSRGLASHERMCHGPANPGVSQQWFAPNLWDHRVTRAQGVSVHPSLSIQEAVDSQSTTLLPFSANF